MVCSRSCLERQRDMLQRSTRAKIKTLLEAFDIAAHQPNALSESDEPTGSGGAGADGLPAGTTQQAHASVDGDAQGEGGGGGAAGGEGGGGGNTCRTAVRKQHAIALMSLAVSNGKGNTDKQIGAASGLSDVESDSEGVTLQLRRLRLEVSPALLPSPTVLSLGPAHFLSSMLSHALRLYLSMCGCQQEASVCFVTWAAGALRGLVCVILCRRHGMRRRRWTTRRPPLPVICARVQEARKGMLLPWVRPTWVGRRRKRGTRARASWPAALS